MNEGLGSVGGIGAILKCLSDDNNYLSFMD
jgi:hypothetical protein